jgi:hypothetical protein
VGGWVGERHWQYADLADREPHRLPALPRPVVLVVAVGIALFELWTAAGHMWPLAKIGYQDLHKPPRLVRDADIDPYTYYLPMGPVVAAEQVIPRDATYSLVVGGSPPAAVREIFRFWLLPRRYTDQPAGAQWVIAYHKSSELLGVPYTKEIGIGPDVNVVQVKP